MTKLEVVMESGLDCSIQCNPKTGEVTDLFVDVAGQHLEYEVNNLDTIDLQSLLSAFKTLQRLL